MRINTNISSLGAQEAAQNTNKGISNGNSAIALLQIADKSMAEQSKILDTIKSKLIQANTDTTSQDGRTAIAKDVTKLLDQLNNIAQQTNYNGTTLLQATATSVAEKSALSFQVGEHQRDKIETAKIKANVSGYSLSALKTAVSAGSALAAGSSATATG